MSHVLRTENVERQTDMIFYGSIKFYIFTINPLLSSGDLVNSKQV